MVSHARESKYVCHFCDKAFYGENTLKVHFKKHLKMQVSDAERIGYVYFPVKYFICEVKHVTEFSNVIFKQMISR